MAKSTDSKGDIFDRRHDSNARQYERELMAIYQEAIREAVAMTGGIAPSADGKPFQFDRHPALRKRLQKWLARLAGGIEAVVANGIRTEWALANGKNDAMVRRLLGNKADRLTPEQRRRYFTTNEAARDAFLARKVKGLGLSERVWNYAEQYQKEIELALDLGIADGRAAEDMARDLRRYLREPDRLFRRVRDERGQLHLSKAAAAYHPGAGVYRSSFRNARRLAVTESNIAYKTADFERWQQMSFVVGIEIELSNNHTVKGGDGKPHPFTDICDELAGRYPKDFKFTGWHPHCRCHAVTIMKTDDEMDAETAAILRGEEPTAASVNRVADVPEQFKTWIAANEGRIAGAKTLPYFLADNADWMEIAKIQEGAFVSPYATLSEQRKAIKEHVEPHSIALDRYGVEVQLSNKNIKEWLNQPHGQMYEKNELLRYIDRALNAAEYKGNGPDEHGNGLIHLFETKLAGKKSWIVVRNYKDGTFGLHSISEHESVLQYITKKDFGIITPGTAIPTGNKPKSYSATKVVKPSEHAKTKEQLLAEQREKQRLLETRRIKTPRCEATNNEEAIAYVKKYIADDCNFDFKKVKIEVVNDVLTRMAQRMEQFNIKKFKVCGSPHNAKVTASYDDYDNSFNINWNVLTNTKSAWQKLEKWRAKGIRYDSVANEADIIRSTIDHELGHKLLRQYDMKNEAMKVMGKCGVSVPLPNGKMFNELYDVIGHYGSTSVDEFFAECVATYFGPRRGEMKMTKELVESMLKKIDGYVIDGEISKADLIKAAAEKRHAARTAEKVAKLKKFAEEHKKQSDALYNEIKGTLKEVKGITSVDASRLEKLTSGKEGATAMKSGEKAIASAEKLRKELDAVKVQKAAYDKAMKQADNILDIAKNWREVDYSVLKDAIKSGDLDKIKAATKSVAKSVSAMKAEEAALADVIPNVHEWHKQFSLEELKEAHDAIKNGLNKLVGKSLTAQKQWLEDEIVYVENPNKFKPHKIHQTFKISQEAYKAKLESIESQIYVNQVKDALSEVESWSASHPKSLKVAKLLADAKAAIANGDSLESIKLKANNALAEYNKRLAEQSRRNAKKVSSIRFGEECFAESRRNAAVWDKGEGQIADDTLIGTASKVWKGATTTEKDYVYEYTHHYCDVNEPLQGRKYSNSQKRSRFEEKVSAITSYIEKSELPCDMWFTRGDTSMDVIRSRIQFAGGTMPDNLQNLVGMTMQEGGFMSTGSRKGKGFSERPVILNIYAPKGTKAAYIEPISEYGLGGKRNWTGEERYSKFSNEHETLFQRGTMMRITKVYKKGNHIYIDCEVIGQEVKGLSYVPDSNIGY